MLENGASEDEWGWKGAGGQHHFRFLSGYLSIVCAFFMIYIFYNIYNDNREENTGGGHPSRKRITRKGEVDNDLAYSLGGGNVSLW